MKRILTSLTFKISMIIILTEIIVLGIAGSVYLNRFSNEIDRSIQGKIQLPGKLINAGLLNLASLTNRTTMNQLVGEELIEGLAISRDLSVFAAINPDLRGQKIQDLPEIDSGLFDFANPRHKIFKAKDYIVDVTPVFHPGQSIPRFFVYIKMGTTSSETEKAGIKRLFFFGSFATVLLTTLIIILSFKLSVFNRITSLLNVLSQVAGGDLSIRTTPGKNPDEIGTLQQGINVMITDLQEIVGSLEQRVQERTIELKDNQDRFAALLESAPDAMVVSNSNGEIVLVNSQTERLFGYDRTELLGYPVELLVPDSKREFHPSHRKQYLADAKIRQMGAVGMELFAQAKNGSLIPVDISLSPIESESGILVVASIRDITERKRVEADIKKLSAAVEQSPASVVITDLNGTIEYVNSRFCEVTGYTSQEAIDQNPRILKSDTHSPELYKKLWETISAGKEWRGEFLNKKKTGELYWESASISPIKSTDGSITHYLAVKEDITNRKAIEDALKKSEERFSLTTAGSGDGLWDFDLPAEFFWYSDRFRELLGYNNEDDYPNQLESWSDGLHPEDREATLNAFNAHLEKGLPYDVEYRLKTKQGEWRWFRARGKSLRDGDGLAIRAAGSITNINDRKQMEDDLQIRIKELDTTQFAMLNMMDDLDEEKEKAEAATGAKSDFLANMSHEIRTPMNAIIGMSHLALKTDLNTKQRDYINKVHMSAQSLLGIINDILDFSKIEAGKLNIEVIDFDLNEVLANLSSLVTMKAQERGVELIFNLGTEVPTHLKGDPLRLGQILLNLANNAVKFTEEGEIEVSITGVKIEKNEAFLRFEVRDTGIGLTEEQRSKLFQSFQQADTSTTRKYGGTGLGLTISKKLSEIMGGEIGVDSVPGEGSTFWFTAKFGRLEKTPKKLEIVPETLKGLKMLVVDDNLTFCEVLKNYLEEFTFNVDTASSGQQAIDMISTNAQSENDMYEMVFMDWQMPIMDGIETAKRIQQNITLPVIPKIIMVTGHGREDVMQQADKINLDGFLLKPVTHSVLFDSVLEAFGQVVKGTGKANKLKSDLPKEFDAIRGARLLLVEDNEINQQVAVELLSDEGFYVTVAENGKVAVEIIKSATDKDSFDVVLMDLQMPVMDGRTAAREIRKLDIPARNVPILAMTADAMSSVREEVLSIGMNDYITKPIEPKELFKTLLNHILPGSRELPLEYKEKTVADQEDQFILPFTELPGIDLKLGLSRARNNAKLYMSILAKFFENNPDTSQNIRTAIGDNDIILARRLAHTVKGVAGTIGAKALQTSAADLESSLAKEIMENISDLITRFEDQLNTIREILKPHVTAFRSADDKNVNRVAGNLTQLLDLLLKLEPHIRNGKPKQSKETMKEITYMAWPDEFTNKIQNMDKQVKKYKFEAAEKIMDEMIGRLKEEK